MKQGTNAAIMRKRNEKAILSMINAGPISRVELAKRIGLTRAAITIIIDDLMTKGYILEEQTQQATVGRQPILLSFNGADIYSVGINVRRTGFYVGITNLNGKVLIEEKYPIVSPQDFFERIDQIVQEQIEKTGIDREKIYGVGVAAPGPIDVKKQKILNPPNFNMWHNVLIADQLRERLGYPIYLENVANANALAEMYYGAAKGVDSFMTLLVDDGIGSGIVLNQQLFRGINELGHTSICYDGVLCECGNRGCLEKYAAIPMLLKYTGLKDWKEVISTGRFDIVKKEAEYLSTAITSANNLFDLEMVILSGDLPEQLMVRISEIVNQRRLHNKWLQIRSGLIESKVLIASAAVTQDFFSVT